MSRDQAIGAVLFAVCVLVLVGYVAGLVWPPWVISALKFLSGGAVVLTWEQVQFWFIAVPVAIAFCIVLAIGAWIGWTMATTPPPTPIEELEKEREEELEEKKEEGAEEEAREEE